jgi:Aspartyl protease
MRRTLTRLCVALGILLVAGSSLARAQPQAVCHVEQREVVPVDLVAGRVLVSLLVNGSPVTVILDTGADRTLLTEATVQQLGVKLDEWASSTVVGVGGYERHRNADPQTLTLGSLALHRQTLAADNTVTVGAISTTQLAGRSIGGLLGQDFLSAFDLAIDLPARRVTLYDVHDCAGRFLPWNVPYVAIPARQPFGKRLLFPVTLDAHPLQAMLDTGSNITLLIAPGLMRLGMTPAMLQADPLSTVVGVGAGRLAVRRHRFNELRIGDDLLRSPSLWTVPLHVIPPVDMLLGTDWLQSHRLWLSYATAQVFIAQ